jgi:hypothetical protein
MTKKSTTNKVGIAIGYTAVMQSAELNVGIISALATGWTVQGSNLGGGEIFRNSPDRP